MSRYPKMTPERVTQNIKEGRGQGRGASFKPWFEATAIRSKGRIVRTMGVKTQRVMHLVSELEGSYQLFADFDVAVIDQCEQVLLDPATTLLIAQKLGFRHPRVRYNGNLAPMTTDLVLTRVERGRACEIAVSVKYEGELNGAKGRRVREKLEIERSYHAIQGRKFCLATDADISPRVMANLRWLRESHREGASVLKTEQLDAFRDAFSRQRSPTKTIGGRIDQARRAAELSSHEGLDAFRLCVWSRAIKADVSKWLRLSSPFISSNEANLGVRLPWAA